MGNILIIGAGAVGRGLIAYRLHQAGHDVTLCDNRPTTNTYLPYVTRKGEDVRWMGMFGVIEPKYGRWIGNTPAFFKQGKLTPDLTLVSVRKENLIDAALWASTNLIADSRIVVCENAPDAAALFKIFAQKPFISFNAIAECVIPEIPNSPDPIFTYVDPQGTLLIDARRWQGEKIEANGVEYITDYDFRWAMKWHMHCATHLVVALLGHQRGHTYIADAIQDPEIRDKALGLFRRIKEKLHERYGNGFALEDRISYELGYMENRSLLDTCVRVMRDLKRKLEPHERLHATRELIGEHVTLNEAIKYAKGVIR